MEKEGRHIMRVIGKLMVIAGIIGSAAAVIISFLSKKQED